MNANKEFLNHVIVGLADLIREVKLHGRTARFDMRAPGLLEEAMLALKQSDATPAQTAAPRRRSRRCAIARIGRLARANNQDLYGALDAPGAA